MVLSHKPQNKDFSGLYFFVVFLYAIKNSTFFYNFLTLMGVMLYLCPSCRLCSRTGSVSKRIDYFFEFGGKFL